MESEKDIEDILKLADNLPRAVAPEELFDSIMDSVEGQNKIRRIAVPGWKVWTAAACLLLLLGLNWLSLPQANRPASEKNHVKAFQEEYFPNTSLNYD